MYQPKYIQGLITSAATRKLDHLRAEEKMMQKEREAEGDLYNDKESFVTQAYKDQMEQVRKAEEEEKKREGIYSIFHATYSAISPSDYRDTEKARRDVRRIDPFLSTITRRG